MSITASIVLSSQHSATGRRLDTFLLRYPLVIHAEFMTHRLFSKNSASSRAIPTEKLIAMVENEPFVPHVWTKNQPGMQGYETLKGSDLLNAQKAYYRGIDRAVLTARELLESGAHKQVINRVLGPYLYHLVVASATEWDNFWKLRIHEAAEPHMQLLAGKMRKAYDGATTQVLQPGQWHLPFVNPVDSNDEPSPPLSGGTALTNAIKLSSARCASTSYKTVDGFYMTLERATDLHDKLATSVPIHASPFEHVAQADDGFSIWSDMKKVFSYSHPDDHRNFIGWRQYRAFVERGEIV